MRIFMICLALMLGACASPPAIVVYVTPTFPSVETPSAVPTGEDARAVAAAVTLTPPTPVTQFGPVLRPGTAILSVTPVAPSTAATVTTAPPATLAPNATATPTNTPPPTRPPGTLLPPVPSLDSSRLGIQLDPTLSQDDWNQALADIARLGVRWVKVQVSWAQLQPNGPDEVSEDFRRLEIYLETAASQGFDILVSVAKAPAWARSVQTEDGPPDDPQALVRFLEILLAEIGPALDAVEVWNEPNLSREWQGKPLNGGTYMAFFAPAYEAIRGYADRMVNDPKEPRTTPLNIITAGLAPTGDNPAVGSRNDRSFLQEMYDAGLGQYPDVYIGIHPYSWGNPPDALCCDPAPEPGWDDDPHFFFRNNMEDFRAIMIANGHAEQRLFLTEFGYATWDYLPGEPPQLWMSYVDECEQAVYLMQAFAAAQALDYVGPVILWNLNIANDVTVAARDEKAAYSMIVPLEPRERAAYWMLYDALRPDVRLDSYSRCPAAEG